MKTEEDEAFDELAKRQGDWGGGFKAKQAMAADKLQEPDALTIAYQSGYYEGKKAALAQPVHDQWRPIETAPKGETIWLGDQHSIRIGFWAIDCWVDDAKAQDRGNRGLGFAPTHWMPLPSAPEIVSHLSARNKGAKP